MKSFLRIKMIKTENESDAATLSQMQEKKTTNVPIFMNHISFISFTYTIKTAKKKKKKLLKCHVVDHC